MAVGYVYCWTDHTTNKLYVGRRKGAFDDSYISTSKLLNEEYHSRPNDFTRSIIAECEWEEACSLENAILAAADAARCESFYNRSNGDKNFVCNSHTNATRARMSATWKQKGKYNCDNEKAAAAWKGQKHSPETIALLKEQRQNPKLRAKSSARMTNNNPMKDPARVAKMLETRRRNREAKKNGSS